MNNLIPKYIYKYRVINNKKHLDIITRQELYFAKPSEFLVPYECAYKIDRKFVRKKISKIITEKEFDEREKENQILYDTILGVFSSGLSAYNDYLWNKFSDNHKGFCIELDYDKIFSQNFPLLTSNRVEYVDIEELPKSKVFYSSSNDFLQYWSNPQLIGLFTF